MAQTTEVLTLFGSEVRVGEPVTLEMLDAIRALMRTAERAMDGELATVRLMRDLAARGRLTP